VEDISKGEQFTVENVRSIRPSYGLPPYRYLSVLDRTASKDIKAGTALKEEHLNE
jgi:sialic acid synthase SpsE